MRTKWLALIGITFIFLTKLSAADVPKLEATRVEIHQSSIREPFYRSRHKLILLSSELDTGNLSVSFLDNTSRLIEKSDAIKVRKSDYSQCSFGICRAEVYEFPLPIEHYSCSVEINLTSNSGLLIFSEVIAWGSCKPLPLIPSSKHLPDLSFSPSTFLSDEGTIEITNLGESFLEKPISVWGFLFDKNGDIIWSSTFTGEVSIGSQDTNLLTFQSQIKSWQKHLACSGLFIIDPDFQIFERRKTNNSVDLDFGSCEEVPSLENGDQIDFQAELAFNSGIISIRALNRGRLPYLSDLTRLETLVSYLDSNQNPLRVFSQFSDSPIFGFGDEKKVLEDRVPEGTCFIQVEVNPNITIKESNYINNRIEIKVCE